MQRALPYWRKGEALQNFGDYLTEYFLERLFYGAGLSARTIRLIGSAMDDGLVSNPTSDLSWNGLESNKTIFWGCGLRSENSLSERVREQCTILSVRGPLSRSALRLGENTPIGDPGLLLPFLHTPKVHPIWHGRNLLVPHFNDTRSDTELLELSGCDAILRPQILPDPLAVEQFIDAVASARFVLAGALHGAITAAAYGIPFGFWDSGSIDVPFKWHDFAASVHIPCKFHRTLTEADPFFATEISPKITFPPLLPMLAAAPFAVRQKPLICAIEVDVARHGIDSLKVQKSHSGLEIQSTISKDSWASSRKLLNVLLDKVQSADLRVLNDDLKKNIAEQTFAIEDLQNSLDKAKLELDRVQIERDSALLQISSATEKLNSLADENRGHREALTESFRLLELALEQQTGSSHHLTTVALNPSMEPPNLEIARRDQHKRSKLQSLAEGFKAVGYILLPYNRRRVTKRKILIEGLRASEKNNQNAGAKSRSKQLRSIRRSLKAIGYIAAPYNRRRREKRKHIMAGLRSPTNEHGK
jgi:hypothetical protein